MLGLLRLYLRAGCVCVSDCNGGAGLVPCLRYYFSGVLCGMLPLSGQSGQLTETGHLLRPSRQLLACVVLIMLSDVMRCCILTAP